MTITQGTILISAPTLDDPNFVQSVILICEHNRQGAMGFVVNELFGRKLSELVEFQRSKAYALYSGGPMEHEKLFMLHRRPAIIEQGSLIADGVYMGGNFQQALSYINQHLHPEKDIKLLLGYCGWDAEQLEAEIKEGSWLIASATLAVIFEESAEMLWEKLYQQIM